MSLLALTACTPEIVLGLHRQNNPDGPYQRSECASPSETGSRWDCPPARHQALVREATAMREEIHRRWVAQHAIPYEANWDRVAACESGGNWSINTGNGYYGGVQFSLATWQSVGGSGYPHQNSKAEQIRRAEILRQRSGLGQWPACGSRWY